MNHPNDLRFGIANEQLIASLKSTGIIRTPRVEEAFRKVQRHWFIGEGLRDYAYQDTSLPIGSGQTISHPSTVARMTELLDVQTEHRVLEIGTGSGYQTAILATLSRNVCSIENQSELFEQACYLFRKLGVSNVQLFLQDGSQGLADQAPFDRIIVTAGSPSIPRALCVQLTQSGKMVIPAGRRGMQKMTVVQRKGEELIVESFDAYVFVDLIGRHGFEGE